MIPSARLGAKLGLSSALAAQSMAFGLALNLHDDIPPDARFLALAAILGATLTVLLLLGGPLVADAARNLRRGRLTVEALFLLTLAGALAASLQSHLGGRGPVYYEVVSVLLCVHALGRAATARGRELALTAGGAWGPATCRVVGACGERELPVADVRPGDRVRVRPGEAVPVDGVVRSGRGFVGEAPLSGEPFPERRAPGDAVRAGGVSLDGAFTVEATRPGDRREIDALARAGADAAASPHSLQRQADRLGRWFLPLVAGAAAGTLLYWGALGGAGWYVALFRAMSVLLVACPCVIGLATPLAVWGALGELAARGLVARTGDAVERLAGVDRIFFDKTGTLSDGEPTIRDLRFLVPEGDQPHLTALIAAAQAESGHPAARPFARLAVPDGSVTVVELRTVPGCGITAELESPRGRERLRVGRADWLGVAGGDLGVEWNGRPAAAAALGERLRPGANAALAELRDMGLPVAVLTGDRPGRAEALGLPPAEAGLSALAKAGRVRDAGGRPLVVGDGANDAPALASAHASIAIGGGADLAAGAAGFVLHGGDLTVIPWAIRVCRGAVALARRNIRRAVLYNLAGVVLAASGNLHPVAAVLLMVASSLSLLFSAGRAGHCEAVPPAPATRPWWKGAVHAAGVVAQAFVFAQLVGLAPAGPAVVAAGVGGAVAVLWHRRRFVAHGWDMAFGMLTVGNAGMLLGWRADAGFGPLECAHCLCGSAEQPGMLLGMLLAGSGAMLWLGHGPAPGRGHVAAMLTGGNLGMVAGMVLGGRLAGAVPVEALAPAAGLHLLGMTAGMLAGMFTGTVLAEGLIVGWRNVDVGTRGDGPP